MSNMKPWAFEQESRFSFEGLTKREIAHHIASFTSGIWQIHPFSEGNTRASAIFAVKYLNSLGIQVGNGPFAENSWYYRNALVRANYTNVDEGVYGTNRYLERFFENATLGEYHELKNRLLHIDWTDSDQVSMPVAKATPQVTSQVVPQVEQLLAVMGDEEVFLRVIAERLGLSDRKNVMKHYVGPALEAKRAVRTIPDKPTSQLQKYRKKHL